MVKTYKHTHGHFLILNDVHISLNCEKVPKLHFYFYSYRGNSKKKKKRLGHGEMGEPQAVSQENENEENAVGKRPVV